MDINHRIAQLSPTKRALLEQKLKKTAPVARPELSPAVAERHTHAPLSFSRERLRFLEQLEPGGSLYNLPAIVPLGGPVDPALVEASVRQVVARHSALRTRFVVEDETPRQAIGDDVSAALDFSIIDLRAADRSPGVAPLSQTLNDEIGGPFDLATGPLVRARLIRQRGDESLLLVVMHHMIADGWALHIFIKEFHLLYEAARPAAWSQASSAPHGFEPSPDAAPAPLPGGGRGAESWGTLYWRHYAELAQIGATLRAVHLRRHDPRATPAAREIADELAARLQELARGVFEAYAHELKQRLSTGGGGPTTPDGLATCCVQLMSVAGLAASLGPR